MEYDVLVRTKTPGVIPAAPINKPLWTCSVECLFEYMRIVFDIYPVDKLIRVVVGNRSLNSWAHKEMNMNQLAVGLANVGPPWQEGGDEDEEFSVIQGLSQAVEALCQPSPAQVAYVSSAANDQIQLQNNGRIICLTHLKSEAHVRSLEECIVDAVNQHNKLSAATDTLLPINQCEVIFVHITPVGKEPGIQEHLQREVSGQVLSEVHSTQSGRFLYYKMVALAQHHYDLSSTTVTGIPMKEEQNASSSANYDVELLHPSAVHNDMTKTDQADGIVIPSKEGLPTSTITLKWCTPKSNVVELHNCSGVYRITPVDVNSRPSSCLTNFLLAGRAVMLEQPRKSGVKVISHMLASHGGEIFVHIIPTCRSALEDPPSISEGCGGRVTDYRITDFGEFMKEHRLSPGSSSGHAESLPISKAFECLERSSRFWPVVISETILGNLMSSISPLPTLMEKEQLTDDEVLECKKVIYNVVSMETKNEPLPVPVVRGKGPRREEQYRQLWGELENLVRAYTGTSGQHEKVLECLLECKKPNSSGDDPSHTSPHQTPEGKPAGRNDRPESAVEQDSDRFQRMNERGKQEVQKAEKPYSCSPPKRSKVEELSLRPGGQNLLSLWASRVKSVCSKRHAEFAGRSEGLKADLYPHLNDDEM